jgi:tetratricopeptide (TPR) repeat protein
LLATEYLSGGLGYAELGFDFTDTFEEYTMAVNKIAMEQFNANNQDKATNYLLKAIDLLMNKNIHKFVRPI